MDGSDPRMERVTRTWGLAILVLAACSPAAAAFTDADKAAIMAQREALVAAWNAGDAEKGAEVYSEDAVLMMANQPAVIGKLAIVAAFRAFPPVSEARHYGEEFLGDGNVAVIRGSASMVMMLPGAAVAVADTSKYIEVWQRQADGSWKLKWDISNSDRALEAFLPPTPAK